MRRRRAWTSEWIQLNRADADKAADLLNKMLGIGPTGAPAAAAGPGGAVTVPPVWATASRSPTRKTSSPARRRSSPIRDPTGC